MWAVGRAGAARRPNCPPATALHPSSDGPFAHRGRRAPPARAAPGEPRVGGRRPALTGPLGVGTASETGHQGAGPNAPTGRVCPGCLPRARGQLPRDACEAVRESSWGCAFPEAQAPALHVHPEGRDREGPGPKAAWEPRATRVCYLGASSLCTSGVHSLTRPAAGQPARGRAKAWPKPRPPGPRLDSRAPARGSHARTQRAWSEHLPAPSMLGADQGFNLGAIPGGPQGGQGDPGPGAQF